MCYSLGPLLPIREEDSSPSEFLGACELLQAGSCERLRKSKGRKKKSGEFSPFSLNVRKPFAILHVREFKWRLLEPSFRTLAKAPLQVWGCLETRPGHISEKKMSGSPPSVVFQNLVFSPVNLILFAFHGEYLLHVFCPGFIAAFSGIHKATYPILHRTGIYLISPRPSTRRDLPDVQWTNKVNGWMNKGTNQLFMNNTEILLFPKNKFLMTISQFSLFSSWECEVYRTVLACLWKIIFLVEYLNQISISKTEVAVSLERIWTAQISMNFLKLCYLF